MSIIKKKDFMNECNQPKNEVLDELVDAEGGMISGDRNVVSNSEIETGPVDKPFNDDSDYEKGVSVTTDRAAMYRQDLPYYVNYSSKGTSRPRISEVITKDRMEEKIEDLVKKNKYDGEIADKNFDNKVSKVLDIISDSDFTEEQIEAIKVAISTKAVKTNKI